MTCHRSKSRYPDVDVKQTSMMSNLGELRQPLQSMKWAARLNAFVLAVVAVNLIIFPLGGAYDPSDFFQTVFKDLPLISLYAFFGIISLFVFVYWLLMPSGQFVLPEKKPTQHKATSSGGHSTSLPTCGFSLSRTPSFCLKSLVNHFSVIRVNH